ncbi:TetR/AcrR family transcriptional regulator [Cytobacillus purgationiresistens]|uniref:AcrR family transcriptional regulator n=1 Tax=Cytobacillus purgationiresistens TaxID=863449 RepID=A0ABU0APG1_9BACI|nr:TetR/AcrR family transcriptional regulator [Cytobacillus purgationiresistens]MDQ0273177.1 AcrR family transcriptional regulator [Cytobacillus purgationiresistens]
MNKRSEATKQTILIAAGNLFSQKGYDAVTMREIAKEAGCSHTTIYLYFQDKVTLLHQLSMPVLQNFYQKLQDISHQQNPPLEKLTEMSREYIYFGLHNKNMYSIFINARSTRVDEEKPELEINKLRNEIFSLLMNAIQECLNIQETARLLAYTRIYYYSLNGVLTTYSYMHESVETIMERLTPTFDLMVETLIAGFTAKINEAGREDESN